MLNKNFKSGFVSIIGLANVGKSTLLNQLLKEKVAIVTPKAQTTRNQIQGIYTTDDVQIIFIDTPGLHKASSKLGMVMNEYAISSLDGADVVLYVADLTKEISSMAKDIIEHLKKLKTPVIFVGNKVDLIKKQEDVASIMESYKALGNFVKGITISASNNYNLDILLDLIIDNLKVGPMYYPSDQLLDKPERFVVAEIIREKVLLNTNQEVPHSVAITIDRYNEKANMVDILASIVVERPSQKKIIIGKEGSMIKNIGIMARKDIMKLLGCHVNLELFVKVEKDWRNKKYYLKEFGYDNDKV